MTQDELYANISNAFLQKRLTLTLNFEECPWEEEYKQGYKEGWHNAFMFAEQILEKELKVFEKE